MGCASAESPSLRRGLHRAAPQSRRGSFLGHGSYHAPWSDCRHAPPPPITARNGGRWRSNQPVEPRCAAAGSAPWWLAPSSLLPRVPPGASWRCSSSRCAEAAPAARVPIRPRYPARSRPLAPGLSCDARARVAAGGVPSELAGAQVAKEMPSGLISRLTKLLRPTAHLRPELPCRGREQVVQRGGAGGPGPAAAAAVHRRSRGCWRRTWAVRARWAVSAVVVVGVVAPAHSLLALGAPPPRSELPPAGSPPLTPPHPTPGRNG